MKVLEQIQDKISEKIKDGIRFNSIIISPKKFKELEEEIEHETFATINPHCVVPGIKIIKVIGYEVWPDNYCPDESINVVWYGEI